MPCLVNTSQGISVLYKEKNLYSVYAPEKQILNQINNLTLTEGTLILCFSPVLNYGLKELSKKLAPNCYILGLELDDALYNFILKYQEDYKDIPNYCLLTKQECLELPEILQELDYTFSNKKKFLPLGSFKRVISINSSAASNFSEYKNMYNSILQYTSYSVMTFWKNRITLTKFGRRYSQHFFKNLKTLMLTKPIQNYFASVNKPILVLGSGSSLEENLEHIKHSQDNYYILCVDTALQILCANNIKVDGVFIEEAQSVILKSFIGTQKQIQKHNTQIFASLSSVPINIINKKHISFFTTEFTKAHFIIDLNKQNLLPPINKPFGSVGLTCFYYALQFRKDDSVPIYVSGLDFSYPKDKTHSKGALAQINKLLHHTKLQNLFSLESSINNITKSFITKENKKFYTTPVLENYAILFNNIFATCKNCYTTTKNTLISLPYFDINKIDCFAPSHTTRHFEQSQAISRHFEQSQAIYTWYKTQKHELEELKSLLTTKTDYTEEDLKNKILSLINNKEYLYLHFADGHKFEYNQSFLNRIRVQIDFFLKIF